MTIVRTSLHPLAVAALLVALGPTHLAHADATRTAQAPAAAAASDDPSRQAAGLLDGRRFVAEAGPLGKPADEKDDVITFADGRFHSLQCDQWGFDKGTYGATRDGDAIRFEATTTSAKHGRLHWRGSLTGGTLGGRFTHYRPASWWRPNPEPIEHWFKGVQKQ